MLVSKRDNSLEIELTSLGISRVDVYVEGKPVLSQDVTDGKNNLRIDKSSNGAQLLKIIGLKDYKVVSAVKGIASPSRLICVLG